MTASVIDFAPPPGSGERERGGDRPLDEKRGAPFAACKGGNALVPTSASGACTGSAPSARDDNPRPTLLEALTAPTGTGGSPVGRHGRHDSHPTGETERHAPLTPDASASIPSHAEASAPPSGGSTIPESDQREMVRLYAEGKSLREITQIVFWSQEATRKALVRHGVQLRSRGGSREHLFTQDELDAVVEPYLAGRSCTTIARNLGIHPSTVRVRLDRAGIKRRTLSEAQLLLHRERLATIGAASLTDRQRKALKELEADGELDTIAIARRTWEPRRATLATMRSLERLGLVARRKEQQGRARINLWRRAPLAMVDALDVAAPDIRPMRDRHAVALPARPLGIAVAARIEREVAGNLWDAIPLDPHERTGGRLEALCISYGTTSRNLNGWRSGERGRVQFDVADRVLGRSGMSWWDIWNEDTVRLPLLTVIVRGLRANAKKHAVVYENVRTLPYGDAGVDKGALARVRRAFEGDEEEAVAA